MSRELPGGLGTTGGAIQPTSNDDRFLVVVVRASGSMFTLSEAEYASYKKDALEDLMPGQSRTVFPRENTRRFDPADFTLILADGRAVSATLIGNWKSLPTLGGFSPGRFTQSVAGKPSKLEEIALACVVKQTECEPPFKVQYLKDPAFAVPKRKLAARK